MCHGRPVVRGLRYRVADLRAAACR
ncbi:hypothetical protein GII30_22700 [Gordonia amarae]|uniref:Uncharacterized protein n=1 Tax=Gordonia amarae TaxID=36821 RepID=A0A857L4T0_9ACTN|nr:hypothetical protein GII35_23165 [Gordonia amarae]QHN24586.1 hypothetical protein GII34_22665 [Gordonia amarae]QHN33516.1 hypothetical protein GII32_22995 [Gordonia amarae]QHN42233.1 hypothetical protein GII30_22700 [Gordonia amarae]